MIGYLKGQVVERAEEFVILDVGGVGYEVFCSTSTINEFSLNGEPREVWVQTQVREDAIQLFGFSTQEEKRLFNSLLKVNGVGPKMAIKILSAASMSNLAQMIEAGDVKSLSGLPKVGKKTAEQLVLSLKGKLAPEILSRSGLAGAKGGKEKPVMAARFAGTRGEILSALINLGFRMQDAEPVVANLPEEIDLQVGLRQGLQTLAREF